MIIIKVIGLHITSGVLTGLLLYWDSLMCLCCSCWLGAGAWRVFDPEEPEASLVWRAGKVVAEDEDNPDQERQVGGANLQNIYEDVSL